MVDVLMCERAHMPMHVHVEMERGCVWIHGSRGLWPTMIRKSMAEGTGRCELRDHTLTHNHEAERVNGTWVLNFKAFS